MQADTTCANESAGRSVRGSVHFGPGDENSGSDVHPACVLVVEDDFFVALDLEYHLTQAGFRLAGIARTAEEAVQIAGEKSPDIAIMDIRLAGVTDGVDAAIQLRERYGIPSVFASAHCDQATRNRAEQARPLAWLEKPYSPNTLVRLIREIFARGMSHG